MRRIGYWISVSIVASIFLMGCAKVKTGQRIKCPNCGRIVQDTVKEINAPFWDKDKHQVITGEQYCDTCGNQTVIVKTGTTRLCESCGRTISRNIRSMEVKRKDMQLYKVEEEKNR